MKAKLQFNTRGAWRDVCEFDESSDLRLAQIKQAAELIVAVSNPQPKVRLTRDGTPAWMYIDQATGKWKLFDQ